MYCYPLPLDFPQTFRTLLHLTCLRGAVGILRTRKIFGGDTDKHANFSVKRPRPDIAREQQVLLTFEFRGNHAAYFGDPFGRGTLTCHGMAPPIAFHIFSGDPPPDWPHSNLLSLKYWQTNLYPGTTELYLKDAKLLDRPPVLAKPSRLIWPWQSARHRHQLAELDLYAKRLSILDRLRSGASGKQFSVP